jgi:hypothetical protein
MSILNRASDGLLSVLLALRRAILAYGPQSEQDLLELVAPRSVTPDGKSEMARMTLRRWRQLGFFAEHDGRTGLESTVEEIAVDDLDGLRRVVLRLLMSQANNVDVATGDDDSAERSKASDFARALSWVLAQDPYGFPGHYRGDKGVEALQDGQGVEPRPFINDTRWNGFAEWAPFVGAGYQSKSGLIPVPTFAVDTFLDELFSGVQELTERSFFDLLATLLPVVDGGKARLAIDEQIARPWRVLSARDVSPTLSAALLELEAAGTLRLESRSDAPTRILTGRPGREPRPLTHLIRMRVP